MLSGSRGSQHTIELVTHVGVSFSSPLAGSLTILWYSRPMAYATSSRETALTSTETTSAAPFDSLSKNE